MDLVAIDVGNARVHLGAVVDSRVVDSRSVPSATLEGIEGALTAAAGLLPAGAKAKPVVVIASVNQVALDAVIPCVRRVLGVGALVIRRDIALPLEMDIDNPDSVGVDRILTAAAAYEVIGRAVVVADFGSALTIDCVDDAGRFMGGTILPGLRMSARALHQDTQSLPEVEPIAASCPFGKNTVDAIQSGLYLGALGALREVVERFATQLGKWPQLVLTGGDAGMVSQHCDFVDSVVPELCLRGIVVAYERHLERKRDPTR